MPGAGTDKTRNWVAEGGPIVILVEPQLGENIGAAARAMANFGLLRLRLVRPRQGWPNDKARMMAACADRILDAAVLFDDLESAIADCHFVLATTARAHRDMRMGRLVHWRAGLIHPCWPRPHQRLIEASSTIHRTSSSKVTPAYAASSGTSDVSVMPGCVLTSRQTSSPVPRSS